MNFEEFKEKANRRFGRKLSDREIAEAAIESMNNSVEHEMELNEEIENLGKQLYELKANQPRINGMSDLERTVSERICEILSLESNACDIQITKDCDGIYMDFKVYGHPIVRCPNEGEEE